MADQQATPSEVEAVALKPCPFCGGQAEAVRLMPGCTYVRCTRCYATTDDTNGIARWNTRQAQPAPGEVIARYAEVAKQLRDHDSCPIWGADLRHLLRLSQPSEAAPCPSCNGLNLSCPDGCGRGPATGELNGTKLEAAPEVVTEELERLWADNRELRDEVRGLKRLADQWRGIASAMGYEPKAHNDVKPTSDWLLQRIKKYRRQVQAEARPSWFDRLLAMRQASPKEGK